MKKLIALTLCLWTTTICAEQKKITVQVTDAESGKRMIKNGKPEAITVVIKHDATVAQTIQAINTALNMDGHETAVSIEDLNTHKQLTSQPHDTKITLIMPYPNITVAARVNDQKPTKKITEQRGFIFPKN
jgi:hypothetical protein